MSSLFITQITDIVTRYRNVIAVAKIYQANLIICGLKAIAYRMHIFYIDPCTPNVCHKTA